MQQRREDQTIGDLFSELSREMTTLVRQEIDLARIEMTQKASRVGRNVAFLAAGGAVVYAGVLAIMAAIILGLAALGVALWLSALVVGLIVVGGGYFLVNQALTSLKQEELAPRQTIRSLNEDKEWVKEQLR